MNKKSKSNSKRINNDFDDGGLAYERLCFNIDWDEESKDSKDPNDYLVDGKKPKACQWCGKRRKADDLIFYWSPCYAGFFCYGCHFCANCATEAVQNDNS